MNVRKIVWLAFAFIMGLTVLPVMGEEISQKTFNDYVLQVVNTYPTDGSEPYAWVNDPGYYGISRDIHYLGQQYIKADEKKRSYCSGITFQVFMEAYELYNTDRDRNGIGDITNLEELEEFRCKWYGVGGDRRTIKHALESSGLGYQAADLSEVQAGDFVQLWRFNGSGHTVIFINWVKNTDGQIIGFHYWSSNSRLGPSYQTEYFGESGKLMNINETYFMKIITPVQ